MTYDDKEGDPMVEHRLELVGFVPDALVVGDCDPAVPTGCLQPFFVWSGRTKVGVVPLYAESGGLENAGELLAEVAVGEKDKAQAARSYRMARSISSADRS